MKKQLLISVEQGRFPSLEKWCTENSFEIIFEPFIQIKQVNFTLPEKHFDWIFCSSKNAVKALLTSPYFESLKSKKWAVISDATSQELNTVGIKASFIGTGLIEEVSSAFAKTAKNETIWFPSSNISRQTIQKKLINNSVLETVVYETINRTTLFNLNTFNGVVVLTSPSNVRSYLLQTTALSNKLYIAFGTSALHTLKANNITASTVLHYSELALINTIKKATGVD